MKNILPGAGLLSGLEPENIFLQGVLLTASNPLTILFWNSVISAQSSRHKMNSRHIFLFGTGCVLSTVVFLAMVAAAGSVINRFLPDILSRALNVMIGLVLIGYGVILFAKKKRKDLADCPR